MTITVTKADVVRAGSECPAKSKRAKTVAVRGRLAMPIIGLYKREEM